MKSFVFSPRCFIADIIYLMSGAPVKKLIDDDVDRFLKWSSFKSKNKIARLNCCLVKYKEFRSIFRFRERHHKFLLSLTTPFLPYLKTIEFGGGGIGGGLLVSHYHAVIFPREAGKNLRVGPGVVIGRNNGDFPYIGDNVYIAANSTVIGGIHIGNNVIIGAGSVVTKDIPDNCVYAGNPAKFIKHIDNDENLLNEIM